VKFSCGGNIWDTRAAAFTAASSNRAPAAATCVTCDKQMNKQTDKQKDIAIARSFVTGLNNH